MFAAQNLSADSGFGILDTPIRVNRIMQQSEDLAVVVLRGSYGAEVDWAVWSTPRRGDLAFMHGLRPIFTSMQLLFRPHVGDGASFTFWETN